MICKQTFHVRGGLGRSVTQRGTNKEGVADLYLTWRDKANTCQSPHAVASHMLKSTVCPIKTPACSTFPVQLHPHQEREARYAASLSAGGQAFERPHFSTRPRGVRLLTTGLQHGEESSRSNWCCTGSNRGEHPWQRLTRGFSAEGVYEHVSSRSILGVPRACVLSIHGVKIKEHSIPL
jgi:hypothetical protein